MQDIVNFLHETQQLKTVYHEGVKRLGIARPDSVADHSLCAAQVGYVIAQLE
jgi:5'-deoxynucleotidase YfbR-like HD superfamily hydrolase